MTVRRLETVTGEDVELPKPGWLFAPKGSEAKDFMWVNPCFDGIARLRFSIPGKVLEVIGIERPSELRTLGDGRITSVERKEDFVEIEAPLCKLNSLENQSSSSRLSIVDPYIELHNFLYQICEQLNETLNRTGIRISDYNSNLPYSLEVVGEGDELLSLAHSRHLENFLLKFDDFWKALECRVSKVLKRFDDSNS